MTDRNFKRLCDATSRSAARHQKNSLAIGVAFIERYGATYSDADVDTLIDEFDYSGGTPLSLKKIDQLMANAGFPKLEGKSHD